MPAPAGFLPGSRGELENNLLPEAGHIVVHDLIQMCDRIGMRKKLVVTVHDLPDTEMSDLSK
jgi:hypothetical protein